MMEIDKKSKLGKDGEDLACDFLLSRGYRILDRNWRSGHLEVDIVSQAPDGLHFVEVKSRTAPVLSTIPDQVTPVKQKRVSTAALHYVHQHNLTGQEIFFDIVSILYDGPQASLRYYPQAWIPMYV